MNREYFPEPASLPAYPPRAQSRERAYWNSSNSEPKSLEQNFSNLSKRDQIWEMKRVQRLHQQIDNSYPSESPSYAINKNSYDYSENSYPSENPSYALNPNSYDYSGIQNYSNVENYHNQENYRPSYIEQAKLSIDQPSYSPASISKPHNPVLFDNPAEIAKKIQNDKKRLYAEELKRQIEERNMLKANEVSRRPLEKKDNSELAQRPVRYASADKPNQSPYANDNKFLEREKKLKYAKELEAQIQQKKRENSLNPRNEEFFPATIPDNPHTRKQLYARELEDQIRVKNRNPSENKAFVPAEFQRDTSKFVLEEERRSEVGGRKDEESFGPRGRNQAVEFEKKMRYKQELQKQIEEQRIRKEEEKKKKKMEDEVVERNIFVEKSDKKMGVKVKGFEIKDPLDELQRNFSNQSLQKEKKSEGEGFEVGKKGFEESGEGGFEFRGRNNGEGQYLMQRAANEILAPFDQEKFGKGVGGYKGAMALQEPRPNNQLIENYMKEIQDVRMERDMAREQCLEMREMMLREKEKSLEQMLSLMKNQSNDTLFNYPERLPIDRPPVYPTKSTSSLDTRKDLDPSKPLPKVPSDYVQAAFDQVHKDLFIPPDYRMYSQYDPPNIIKESAARNPKLDFSKPDPFEKSLASQSKFIELPPATKWTEPSSENTSNRQEKPRKRWEAGNAFIEHSEPASVLVKYDLDQGNLEEIAEDNESLPGKATQVSFYETKQKSEDDFYKEFHEKYVNPGFFVGSDKGEESLPKAVSRENEEIQSSRKGSARGQRAFSRLQEARKHAFEVGDKEETRADSSFNPETGDLK